MILDAINSNRLERAVANVERQRGPADAGGRESSDEGIVEVEAGGRCGNCARLARVDGLVTLAILGAVRPMDVRRKRNVPERVDRIVNIGRPDRLEGDSTSAEEPLFENAGDEPNARRTNRVVEDQPRPWLELLTRMNERPPVLFTGRVGAPFEEQAFDGAAARVATAEESRREHSRVVGHHEIAWREKRREILNRRFLPRASVAVDDQQARLTPSARLLCDELGWQLEVERRDERHRRAGPAIICRNRLVSQIASATGTRTIIPKTATMANTNT